MGNLLEGLMIRRNINMNLLSGFCDLIKLLEETRDVKTWHHCSFGFSLKRKRITAGFGPDPVSFQPWLMIHFDSLETAQKMIRAIIE
jgi:hypothetical protein